MFPVFLVCMAAFAAVIPLLVWYARFMFMRIYGNTRLGIDAVVSGGVPPGWEQRLVKGLAKAGTAEKKGRFLERHKKFVHRRTGDFILFMKNTSVISSEAEREACLERLEAFRREYPERLDDIARYAGAKTLGGSRR